MATLAIICGACGGGGSVGAKALSEQAKTVQSEAAEGALLARDAAAGKATAIYTHEHASELGVAAAAQAAALKKARTEPALEPQRRRLAAVATRVAAELEALRSGSADERRMLGSKLQAAADELK